MLMDSVFGKNNFRNDITWKRTTAHSDGKKFGRNTDTILYYSGTGKPTWNEQYVPYDEKHKARFRQRDPRWSRMVGR